MKAKEWLPAALVSAGVLFNNGCLVVREHPRAVVVTEAPPQPLVEVVPAASGPAHVWIEGNWAWRGRWV